MKLFQLSIISAFLLTIVGCASKQAAERDQAMFDELVNRHHSEIDLCFQNEAKQNPQLGEGSLMIRADHLPNGEFSNIRKLKSFPGSDAVFDCIASIMKDWKTERPSTRGPVDLTWKFEKNG